MKISDIRTSDGKLPSYGWPGGYPLFYTAGDGSTTIAPKLIME